MDVQALSRSEKLALLRPYTSRCKPSVPERRRAAAERMTLIAEIRLGLEEYAERRQQADAAIATIHLLRGDIATGGRRFTRDELTER